MSFTGHEVTHDVTVREARQPGDTGMIAAGDITRTDTLGRTVVVVAKGQPIPAGLSIEPGEAIGTASADTSDAAMADERRTRRRAQPDIGGQQRMGTRVERMVHLATRQGPR